MSSVLGHPVARAMLVGPPEWRRTARFAATAWLLATAGLWAAQLLHQASHETLALTPGVHLLRDAALAVPLAGLALAIGGLLAGELAHAWRLDTGAIGGRVTWAVLTALVFAVLSIPGQQAHALLFGAEQETGDWMTDIGLDSAVVLMASLVALVPAVLLRLAPWPPGVEAGVVSGVGPGAAPSPHQGSPATRGTRSPAFERMAEQGASRDA
jgi:hypothetical protein